MTGPDKPKGQWLRLSTLVLTDPSNPVPGEQQVLDAIGAAFGPWTLLYGTTLAPMPPAAPDAQFALTAARALLTDAVLLFRGYEGHHRAQAKELATTTGPNDAYDQLQVADRLTKAERNAAIAARIERWLDNPGAAWGAGYIAPPQPMTVEAENPAEALRRLAVSHAAATGREVDHKAFDTVAEHLAQPAA